MNKIIINDLRIDVIIGVLPQERLQPQTLQLTLELCLSDWHCVQQDAIELAVDYRQVTQVVSTFLEDSQYQLIETLADRLAAHVLSRFPLTALKLMLIKQPLDMPEVASVAIVIERQQSVKSTAISMTSEAGVL